MAQRGQSDFPLPHHQNSIHRLSNSSSGSSSSQHDSLFSPSPSAPDSFTTTPRITPEPHKQHSLAGLAQSQADAEFGLRLHEGEQAAYQQQQGAQLARFRPYPPELYTQAYAYYPYPTHSTAPHGYPTCAASHRAGIIYQGMGMVPADAFSPPYLHPNAYAAVMGQQQGDPNAGIMQQPALVGSSWGSSKGKRRASDNGPAGSTKKQKNPRIRPDVDPNF
ncbi:hypothetical protein M405DRAFT_864090, partial [Rhizopogon salebrosus TDB-379]